MRLRAGGWPIVVFALGVFALILAEISALIWVSKEIGWWTLALLLTSAVVGLLLMRWQWGKAWRALADSMRTGVLPAGRFADASLILIGGLLLVIPGLISDIVGLLMLIPFTRQFVRSAVSWGASRVMKRADAGGPVVISGEVVEEDSGGDTLIPGVIEGTVVDDDPEQGR